MLVSTCEDGHRHADAGRRWRFSWAAPIGFAPTCRAPVDWGVMRSFASSGALGMFMLCVAVACSGEDGGGDAPKGSGGGGGMTAGRGGSAGKGGKANTAGSTSDGGAEPQGGSSSDAGA